ncbi:MAG: VanZ family protein [Chloroflexi bacterium]|nr:VanZ family protein [Chloroflexota bacterium]
MGAAVCFIIYTTGLPTIYDDSLPAGTSFLSILVSGQDFAQNIVLYIPLGFFLSLLARKRRIKWYAVAGVTLCSAAVLSCGAEFVQQFFPGRSSSIVDVFCNLAGAAVGGASAFFFRAGSRPFRRKLRDLLSHQPIFLTFVLAAVIYVLLAMVPFQLDLTPRTADTMLNPARLVAFTPTKAAELIPHADTARAQYAHAIDMVPTILDALDFEAPRAIRGVAQSPLEGVSFGHTFADPDAPTRHETQYFEMFAHRAIDHDGWRAVCPWPGVNFTEAAKKGRQFGSPVPPEVLDELETSAWELYHVAEDPTESHNVAAEHPEKLRELISMWWVEAGKYKVLPIDGDVLTRMVVERPQTSRPRTRFIYYPGLAVVPMPAAPKILNRPHSIEADVEIPEGGAEGVLLAQGGAAGGFVFYVKDNKLRYAHNYAAKEIFEVESQADVPAGRQRLRFEFEPTGPPDLANGKGVPGRLQLYIDGKIVGNVDVPHTTPAVFELEGLSCGYDFAAPVLESVYKPPFTFTGTIHSVTVDVAGDLIEDDEATLRRMMAQQ